MIYLLVLLLLLAAAPFVAECLRKPMDDRNYYRMLDDEELIALSKNVETSELALVLAERLSKATRKLEAIHYDEKAAQPH